MRPLKLFTLLITTCLPIAASATIKYEKSPIELQHSLSPTTTEIQKLVHQKTKRKSPRLKTPGALCEEMKRRLNDGKADVGNLGNHYLLKLNEIELGHQYRTLEDQLFNDSSDDNIDDQLSVIAKKLRLAKAVRQHLNGAWEDIKQDNRNKKHFRHKRDIIQGSLFVPPLLPDIRVEEALFHLNLEKKTSQKLSQHTRDIKGSLFESPFKPIEVKPLPASRHKRTLASHMG